MQLDWTDATALETIRGGILHEFAHALSRTHEHQRACSPISFDLEALGKYCKEDSAPGWKDAKFNFLRKPKISPIAPFLYGSEFITHYGIPAILMKAGKEILETTMLSEKDKALITYLYPKPYGGTPVLGKKSGKLQTMVTKLFMLFRSRIHEL